MPLLDIQNLTVEFQTSTGTFRAVDGVSLTVNSVKDIDGEVEFGLNIIPHTWAVTTLGTIQMGQSVNIEIDVLARYLQRMEHYRVKAS